LVIAGNIIKGRADLIEIWLDGLYAHESVNKQMLSFFLRNLQEKSKAKLLGVCKNTDEGGVFIGDEDEKISILQDFLSCGGDFVDLDCRTTSREKIAEISSEKLFCSFHDFDGVPENLKDILIQMKEINPAIYKFAVTTNEQHELDKFIDFVKYFQKLKMHGIFTTMGNLGGIGRERIGDRSIARFVALNKECRTAEGQKTLDDL
jgi:3-dehydroquinate dehydratase type I